MQSEPTKAYVYQPFPPRQDGKSFGVGGLTAFGLDFDLACIRGIDKPTAEEIVRVCNENPDFVESFIRGIKHKLNL